MMRANGGRIERRIVLIGGGHAHVGVVKAFAMSPEPGVELVLVAKELDAPYSGMLPGFVAGHYDLDECHIDLVRLAHFAGVRLIHGEAIGLDRNARTVAIAGRPPLVYDLLSIDTGITPFIDDIRGAAENAIAVKPVSTFAPRWKALEERALGKDGPRRISVVGTGAAGFELILAMRHKLREAAASAGIAPDSFRFALIGSGALLPTHNPRAQALAHAALAEAGVELITGEAAVEIDPAGIRLASGRTVPSDATLVTTKAQPPRWFADTGLSRDEDGFLALRPTLQAVNDDDIFAAGDCATVLEHRRERAGVFAVRQAEPLHRNLRLRIRGRQPKEFVPQRQFLTLLSCGDRTAIAARGRWAAAGAWAWQLKDRIDRAFMRKFQALPAVEPGSEAERDLVCAGCAAKLGPASLTRALKRLPASPSDLPVRDISPGDDAAVLDIAAGPLRLESVDYFPAIWPDPFVLGAIAAAHALGDIAAMGGTPDHVMALAGLPDAAPHLAEDDLVQLLSGAREVLDAEGIALVGGHTSRTESLAIGFFAAGTVPRNRLLAKKSLAVGDALILTKALGTGIIFAGWMRGLARAREVFAALQGMRVSSTAAGLIMARSGATSATDVTGFGLGGHLIEMLELSGVAAEIDLSLCPRYPGVERLLAAGVRSSLLPDNLSRADKVALAPGLDASCLDLLFDPQTSGGLVAGVPRTVAQSCVAELNAAGIAARIIGHIKARQGPSSPVLEVTSPGDTGI